jgi:tetratricopeptide (TPR) repeat protein
VAALAAQVGRFRFFAGQREVAAQQIETALRLAEALSVPETLSQALNTKALLLLTGGRRSEGSVLLRHALDVALDHDKPSAALRAFYNLADAFLSWSDRYEEAADTVRRGLAHARMVGSRYWEWAFLGYSYPLYALGAWDEVLTRSAELPKEDWTRARLAYGSVLSSAVPVCIHRGDVEEAKTMVAAAADFERSADLQERSYYSCAKARILLAEGNHVEALALAESVFSQEREHQGVGHDPVKESFALAVEAAFELDLLDRVEELLTVVEQVPPGVRPHFLDAHLARFRAHLAARAGNNEEAERLFKGAGGLFQELAVPFPLAVTRLEHAEWLAAQGRIEETQPLVLEAREIFERLEAKPWLDRLDAAHAHSPTETPPGSLRREAKTRA